MKKLLIASLLFTGALAAQAADTAAAPATLPEVDHWVYLSELPDPAELTQNAAANGLSVQRLDQTADAVVITYKYPDGVVGTMGYKLLSSVRTSERVVARVQPPSRAVYTSGDTTTVVVKDDPEIIYVEREPRTRVVYRERDDFWLPLTLGLGIGYVTGHHSHHHYSYPRYHYSGHYRSYRGGHRGRH
ncbi:hypothetical protein ESB00_13170 [Oleiharenicola lentus]|jgi:hypothetical protein|uniref:Uncharacterized protein n=1 Tax=Oleiharenicola lentus TaxID=2508720 RepID=A0A4Q1CCS9_9BACT|nr:hypothetical protein [Oleiharenicola lentus]RXK56776.1 hypothetical protein ESB00_13170 [Oleiharenicola lentus]